MSCVRLECVILNSSRFPYPYSLALSPMVWLASEICVSNKACLAWHFLFHWATSQRPQSAYTIEEILMREYEGRGIKVDR